MKIRLKDSLVGEGFAYGKGFYRVPSEMKEEHAREFLRCGHAELISDGNAQNPATTAEKAVKKGIEKR